MRKEINDILTPIMDNLQGLNDMRRTFGQWFDERKSREDPSAGIRAPYEKPTARNLDDEFAEVERVNKKRTTDGCAWTDPSTAMFHGAGTEQPVLLQVSQRHAQTYTSRQTRQGPVESPRSACGLGKRGREIEREKS